MLEQIKLMTQELKLKDILPDKAQEIAEKYDKSEDDILFIRKGITPNDLEIDEDERAVISYITTKNVDRDKEIVDPDGAVLRDYKKHPVVLFGHKYHELPIGRNEWIKADDKGLIAKTIYANHEEAEKIFQYRKDGFPLAESIGFVPLEWEDYESDNEKSQKNGGAKRKYTKWILLEYSDVPIPSNPEALQVAISKGLIPERRKTDMKSEPQKNEIEEKEGRVLSRKNRELVKKCADMLVELYNATEQREQPKEIDATATFNKLLDDLTQITNKIKKEA